MARSLGCGQSASSGVTARSRTLRLPVVGARRSLPAVGNIACVLLLFMYTYAVFGMNMWGNVKRTDKGITRHANFVAFPTAMLTEFRMITGENW